MDKPSGCDCGDQCGGAVNIDRRSFLKLVGASSAGVLATGGYFLGNQTASASVFNYTLIPANKNFDPDWVKSLFARGEPTSYAGPALANIGMPVGGICCGQLYLAGDGRLWLWDVFNSPTSEIVSGRNGEHYVMPLSSNYSPVQQGFALKVGGQFFKLDSSGFANITFQGQYPIGTVNYSDSACPVAVKLEAFSPFIPLDADDSGIPATVMEFTLTNPTGSTVEVEIAGWLQNSVCAFTTGVAGILNNQAVFATDHIRIVSGITADPALSQVLYDDFERTTYAPWVAAGTAFGNGPVNTTSYPSSNYQFLAGFHGRYVVSSHANALGTSSTQRDAAVGTLTSPSFILNYDQVFFLISGGNHPGQTCFNLCRASDNTVLLSATGTNSNTYTERVWNVSAWKGQSVYFQVVDNHTGDWGNIGVDYIRFANFTRADIVFDDFERNTYSPWVATDTAGNSSASTAFGTGPINISAVPSYQSPATMEQHGSYLVNSHASAPGGDIAAKDAATGILTSPTFTISRHYINFLIGGGNHPGQTCINLLVGGLVVRSATSVNSNQLAQKFWDVRNLEGQTGQLQVVDNVTGGWANVGIDYIVFSDAPPGGWVAPENAVDNGTMCLSLLNPQAADRVSLNAPVDTLSNLFLSLALNQMAEATLSLNPDSKLIGALSRPLTITPGASAKVTFVIGWHFPKTQNSNSTVNNEGWTGIQGIGSLQKYYATRFADAGAVAAYVAANYSRLSGQTRLWRDTWYDSTLPNWFLDRTFANTSILATNTSHRFSNGRFWGWEGSYCCPGTCTHVWQYAQAVARIFPSLERDTRQRVDFGIGFNSGTGMIGFRAESSQGSAVDGQAGTILRAYREHQMSVDNSYLAANWSKIKSAMQYLLTNFDSNRDGILEGSQWNTLDAAWYGKISWLSGLYIAACRACQQMAMEMSDAAFAAQLGAIAQSGADYMRDNLFYNESYFIQVPDSSGRNTGAGWGCEIDQVLGQSWAFQVGLGQILDKPKTISALDHLWTFNFAPDAGGFRTNPSNPVNGGRPYAMTGEAGLVMSTFPDPAHPLPSSGVVAGYFNECMSGFEHEVASHMIWAGMLQNGLAVTRAIHDRYSAVKRNPYNEVECGDHYARAMASYGTYIAMCGYEYHGPKGYLAFSPKLAPENFKAALTTAAGWGSFAQQRTATHQIMNLSMLAGSLDLKSFAFDVQPGAIIGDFQFALNGTPITCATTRNGDRVTVTFENKLTLFANQSLVMSVASSVPKIISLIPSVSGSRLSWQSVPGITYSIQASDALPGVWQTIQSGVRASMGNITTYTDAVAPVQPQRFYRILVDQ